jgi:pyridoxine/pyridoxamine 5'-phosphate oxidase
MVEFWFGREFRLHDRTRWKLDSANSEWHSQLLYP